MSEVKAPQESRALVRIGSAGVQLHNIEEAMRFCKYVVASGLAPKGDTEATVFVKLQAGAELGFAPMRSLAAMAVVNGRLSLMGEALLAKIRQSGVGKVKVYNEGQGENRAGVMELERLDTGEKDKVVFTLADAKTAKLAGKDTYQGYADDMLVWRAVARGAKRYFSDITMGLEVAEVAREIPPAEVQPMASLPPGDPDPLLASVTTVASVATEPPAPLFASHQEADAELAAEELKLTPETPRKR